MAKQKKTEFVNRKARHDYTFLETLEAGIVLSGTEIKSIRGGHVNLRDAYCIFQGSEMWVRSVFIGEYKQGNIHNHEERQPRKLLLKKQELKKWQRKVKEKGFTIVPYRLYLNERGIAKLEIALVQGKKTYDKRETIKARDNKVQLDRVMKKFN
ncbi:SsrA-binding protein SmpB [Neolewinella lacunae]|uniref:SsrA-binding protein n=1 Tax=Neolewinella lacunae TaxID=1517758 RepID=A0A923PQC5_9BACT|nr:SsrA-binding protein SmpB [Neolewinella lacunae]MBC6995851.1 SsrA-binding protein SmpB [Neolewinella lacunae]MDN3636456.1 SsrA-binding protein SmpB [Neolewinella lacunae]